MKEIILIIILAVHLISWVWYQKYQFLERDLYSSNPEEAYANNKLWHKWKGINHLSLYLALFLGFGLKIALGFAVLFWALFDALINIVVLNRPPFYVGVTADTDKFLRKLGNFLHIKAEIASVLIKLLILLITFTIL
jgi:hypothetical protein